jgi:glycosyltransferase involved in cell wall biosynthesis
LLVLAHPSFPAELDAELDGFAQVRRARGGRVRRVLEQQLLTWPLARRFRAQAVFNAALSGAFLGVGGLPEVSMAHDVRHAVRAGEFPPVERLYRCAVYNRTIRRSVLLTCGGAGTRDAMFERMLADPSRVRVIPLGADHVDRWRRGPKGRHGVAFAHWVNKRPQTAIRAWGALRSRAVRNPERATFDRPLDIVGASAQEAPRLAALAAAEGVDDLVRIHGRLPDDAFQELLSGAAVLLLPSTLEGFGIPVIEAMRLGIPVVASARAGIEQAGGDAALYADGDDPAAFAAQCGRLFADEVLAAEVIRRGHERAACATWAATARSTRAAVHDAVLLQRAWRAPRPAL